VRAGTVVKPSSSEISRALLKSFGARRQLRHEALLARGLSTNRGSPDRRRLPLRDCQPAGDVVRAEQRINLVGRPNEGAVVDPLRRDELEVPR